jgi:chromosome segregation ATPase
MAAALSAFQLASDLGPSPSREAELEEQCRRMAAENERLQDIAAEAHEDASPEEKQKFFEIISKLDARIKELEKPKDELQETVKQQSEQIGLLRDGIVRLQNEVASCIQQQGQIAGDLATGLRRIKAMEERNKPQKTDVTLGHINALALELLTRAKAGQRGVTYAEAAKILKLDKSRVCQLRGLIASDSRFNVDWHPNKKNTKVICLKNYKTKEIVELNVQ